MNATVSNGTILVTLSRRNLLALLHKVDDPSSKATLERCLDDGSVLYVHAETDEQHYDQRPHAPGRMTRETETFIADYSRGKVVCCSHCGVDVELCDGHPVPSN